MSLPRTGTLIDTIRLASGLTLFTYALLHFLNHALGLWSLQAMATFQVYRLSVTRSPVGTVVLATAFLVHVALAFRRIATLTTWRLPAAQLMQLGTGVAIALMIPPHLIQAGLAPRASGVVMTYPAELGLLWPSAGLWQTALLLLVWMHGCIGLQYWLRGERWWRRVSHAIVAVGVLIPAASIAGFVTAGREVARAEPPPPPYGREALPALRSLGREAEIAAAGLAALALTSAGASALFRRRRHRRFAVSYEPGPKVLSAPGPTLLEISRAHAVPHLSVCGGKARCSTCRVRVLAGGESLPAPEDAEARLLRRIGAEPDVRLACQIRPETALTVNRLLKPEAAGRAFQSGLEAAGVVRVAAVLFVDIRGFTRLSEAKLAFDVVYILNTFFTEAGRAVEGCGGVVDKYMGDGLMAVFEHRDGLGPAVRNAFAAVKAIDKAVSVVNKRLGGEIDAPLGVAMGLHGGRLVSGRVGYGSAAHPTVIGRVVNIASRLESLAKARNAELAVSVECAEAYGLDVSALPTELAELRGLESAFPVAVISKAANLAAG